jgi:K+-sensing histidine kinase KdpD
MTNFKNKMLNSMSHNLKTPLNGILMLATGGEFES